MNAIILLASIATAYVSARLSRRRAFGLADLVIGLFCGLAGAILPQHLQIADAAWPPALPLFIACALTIGLGSLQHRPSLR